MEQTVNERMEGSISARRQFLTFYLPGFIAFSGYVQPNFAPESS